MFKNKILFPIFIMTFFFMGAFLMYSDNAMAAENLSQGSRSNEVVNLQQILNNNGYWCGPEDGIFGSKTHNAVIKFQNNVGIKADGIVGPKTRLYLGMPASSSATIPNYDTEVSRGSRTITMLATGYCPCYKCNYPYYGQPSYLGDPLTKGIIAVDPNIIPMGSRLYIEGYGYGIASDQGGAIKGNHIDLCFDGHQEALDWGMRYVKVTIL